MAGASDDNTVESLSALTRRSTRDAIAPTTSQSDDHKPTFPELLNESPTAQNDQRSKKYFSPDGKLRPFRLLREDLLNLRGRWLSDWTVFNQQIIASAVYMFFTNILPGITFASDLYVLTGKSWGTIEIVFSTGLCGVIFAV